MDDVHFDTNQQNVNIMAMESDKMRSIHPPDCDISRRTLGYFVGRWSRTSSAFQSAPWHWPVTPYSEHKSK